MDRAAIKGKHLAEYKVEIWQGLVFVSVNPDAKSLSANLGKLEERFQPYDLANYTVVHREEGAFSCNWKVLVENFCESYHVFSVHKNSLELVSPTRLTKIHEGGPGFNHHSVEMKNPELIDAEALARLPEDLRPLGHLACIYPCLAFSIDPEMALWLTVRPTGPQTLKYTVQIAMLKDVKDFVLPEYISQFMGEDKEIIEGVQIGMAARVENAGVLNPWERTNWEFGHYLARKLLGTSG